MGPQNFPDLLMNLTELVGKPARLYANPTCLERMAPMRAISPRHDSQVAAMMGKVDDLVDAYHSSLSTTLAPSSITLNSFAKFFVVVWVYTASPVLACKELAENPGAGMSMGFFLALGYTFMTACANEPRDANCWPVRSRRPPSVCACSCMRVCVCV